jgi:hypothetical protein
LNLPKFCLFRFNLRLASFKILQTLVELELAVVLTVTVVLKNNLFLLLNLPHPSLEGNFLLKDQRRCQLTKKTAVKRLLLIAFFFFQSRDGGVIAPRDSALII